MQFIKTRNVKDPIRDVNENAGIDFYIPEATDEFLHDLHLKNPDYVRIDGDFDFIPTEHGIIDSDGKIYIPAHKDIIIPSGIRSKFEPNLALIANNKSGIATKKKLIFGASVIDNSYTGEWHLHMINWSDECQVIECGTKIVQFIPHLISTDPVEIVDQTPEEFYKDSTSKRKDGWAGSTGVK